MIVVTHEMGFARDVADRVLFMADGVVVEEGSPKHIFTEPRHERTRQFLQSVLEKVARTSPIRARRRRGLPESSGLDLKRTIVLFSRYAEGRRDPPGDPRPRSPGRDEGRPRGADDRPARPGSAALQERALRALPWKGGAPPPGARDGAGAFHRPGRQAGSGGAARRAPGAGALRGWLVWERSSALPGGCPFVAVAVELDDRPGPARDFLVQAQRDWLDVIANSARTGIQEGQFRPDFDADQFAYDLHGTMLSYHHVARLLRDPIAETRVRRAFESLLDRARRPGRVSR